MRNKNDNPVTDVYRENDNLNMEEINRYRRMTQEERDKLIAEEIKRVLAERQKQGR